MRLAPLVFVVLTCCTEKPAPKPNPHELALKKRLAQAQPPAEPAPPPLPPPVAAPTARLGDFLEYDLGSRRVRLQVVALREGATLVHVSSPTIRWLRGGVLFQLLSGGETPPPRRYPQREDAQLTVVEVSGTKFSCRAFRYDESGGDGPRGRGCWHSTDPALVAGGGLVSFMEGQRGGSRLSISLVGSGNAELPADAPLAYPPGSSWTRQRGEWITRMSVSSAVGLLVSRFDRLQADGGLDASDLAGETIPEHLAWLLGDGLSDNDLVDGLPAAQRPGPTFTSGPVPFETIQIVVPRESHLMMAEPEPVDITVAASPEKLVGAPLPVRFGPLERREKGEVRMRLTEWSR